MTIKTINGHPFIKYEREKLSNDDVLKRSTEFYTFMDKRRTVREFSDKEIPKEVIENIIKAASTAPSGAHKQPWTFCAVSNPEIKKQIRIAAEKEEYENYHGRMSEEWLKDLTPFATNENKEFLEIAPWLIVVFKHSYHLEETGEKTTNYYVQESVGIATGILLTAIHQAGLVALTHTPSPMNFLAALLERPKNEKPFLLIPVGHPADGTFVPDIARKPLTAIAKFY